LENAFSPGSSYAKNIEKHDGGDYEPVKIAL